MRYNVYRKPYWSTDILLFWEPTYQLPSEQETILTFRNSPQLLQNTVYKIIYIHFGNVYERDCIKFKLSEPHDFYISLFSKK